MNHTFKTHLPLAALLLCGAFAVAPAWAAPTIDPAELAELAARHRQERGTCMKVPVASERADCLQDANAAYGHAKRNRASDIDPPYVKNATQRCEALTGDDRRHCLARMGGQGTTTGSAAEGGIFRELVIFETLAVPAPAPTPASTPPAAVATVPSAPSVPIVEIVPAAKAVPAAPALPSTPSATNNPTTPK